MPSVISKHDGTRDQVVIAFNDMDYDEEGLIDLRKFLRYIDNMEAIAKERQEQKFIENENRRKEERSRQEKEVEERRERDKAVEEEDRLRVEREKAEEEERLRVEREKAEEEERLRVEREKAEEEERLRVEREKAEEEERLRAEREKAEEEESLRVEREKAEEEERLRAERVKAAEEERLRAEREKAEEEERLRVEREKAEEEERLRAERVKAAEEERLRVEREHAEEEERLRVEREKAEEEERLRVEREHAEEEERLRVERVKAEEDERLRVEQELANEKERLQLKEDKQRVEEEEKLYTENEQSNHRNGTGQMEGTGVLDQVTADVQQDKLQLEIARKKERKRALAQRAEEMRQEKELELKSKSKALDDSTKIPSKVATALFPSVEEGNESGGDDNQNDGSKGLLMSESMDSPNTSTELDNSYEAIHGKRLAERQRALKTSQRRGTYFGTYKAENVPPPPPARIPSHSEQKIPGVGEDVNIAFDKGTVIIKYQELTTAEIPQEAMDMIYSNPQITRKKSAFSFVHTLVMSHNKITFLNCEALDFLFNLKHLDFSYNQLEKISGRLPSNLTSLKLRSNRLRRIDDALTMCSTLEVLDVSKNFLRGVDGLPPSLLELDVSDNQICGELNLRMLSLVPKVHTLAVVGNPVLAKYKNCNAHLLTLIPKLKVINYQVLPRLNNKVSSSAATTLSIQSQSRGRTRNRKSMSSVGSSRSYNSQKRKSLSPSKQRKLEQAAHIASLATSYITTRKTREKILKQLDEEALQMSKKTAHRVLSPSKLEESTRRLNSWRPHYMKQLEAEERRLAEEKQKELEKKRRKEEMLANSPRKRIFGLRSGSRSRSRSPTSGHSMSSRSLSRTSSVSPLGGRAKRRSTQKLYGPEAREALCRWMSRMQVIMSAAYTQICSLVDNVCAEAAASLNDSAVSTNTLHRTLKERQVQLETSKRRGTFFGMYSPDSVPTGPSPFDKLKQHYRDEIFELLEDIRLNYVPNANMDEDIADDVINWHEDVQNCKAVLTFLHSCLIFPDLELYSFRNLVKTLITLLQRDEKGNPLEFVAWGNCAEKCHVLSEDGGFVESNVIASAVSYSPIHSRDDSDFLEVDPNDGKENHCHNNEELRDSIINESQTYEIPRTKVDATGARLTDYDVDTRMKNLRNRVIQRNQLEGSLIPQHYAVHEKKEDIPLSDQIRDKLESEALRNNSNYPNSQVVDIIDTQIKTPASATKLFPHVDEHHSETPTASQELVTTPQSNLRKITADDDVDSAVKEAMMAHPCARFFHLLDRSGDGRLTLIQFITGLRNHPQVAAALKLPSEINHESGSYNMYEYVFKSIDSAGGGFIDMSKFLSYIDKVESGEVVVPIDDVVHVADVCVDHKQELVEEDDEHEESEDEGEETPLVVETSQVVISPSVTSPNSGVSSLTEIVAAQEELDEKKDPPVDRTDSMRDEDATAANLFSKMESLKAKIFSPASSPARSVSKRTLSNVSEVVEVEKQRSDEVKPPVSPMSGSLPTAGRSLQAKERKSEEVPPKKSLLQEGKRSESPKHSHGYLFDVMDRNGDGELSLTEFIVALRGHPEVSVALKLPQVIRQEDGSRDKCVHAFNDMDDDNSNYVDKRKFLRYFDKVNGLDSGKNIAASNERDDSDDDKIMNKESQREVIETPFLSHLMNQMNSSGKITIC